MEKTKVKKLLFIIFTIVILLFILNIKVNAETQKFTLKKTSIDVKLNSTDYISYSGGTGTVTWKSSDPSIATVDGGLIKGLKVGTTTVTATRGSETATCTVNVIYSDVIIASNQGNYTKQINLILGEHDTENLKATVKDAHGEAVSNASVTWSSSDNNIVAIDSKTGTMKAKKAGEVTITVSASGVSNSCKVNVYDNLNFMDFSKAKFETELYGGTMETLKISGIQFDNTKNNEYYYMVTSDNKKPDIVKKDSGAIDQQKMQISKNYLLVNTKENYMYTRELSRFAELNQDLYIWIIQQKKLENTYYDENEKLIYYASRFVVEGKKLTRAKLPQLNLILQSFAIGSWDNRSTSNEDSYTYMHFNFPTDTENRKFTIKIGEVTDNTILSKIQKNDYEGITKLLTYAKTHDAVYTQNLVTTQRAYYRNDSSLFDGNKLLKHKKYYYIYVQFDDENGKYYPIEAVTLGQAWLSNSANSWDLFAYTSDDFKWDNLSFVPENVSGGNIQSNNVSKVPDNTVAPSILPQTGLLPVIVVTFVLVILIGGFCYIRYNSYKDIN